MVYSTGRHLPDSNFESSMLNLGGVPVYPILPLDVGFSTVKLQLAVPSEGSSSKFNTDLWQILLAYQDCHRTAPLGGSMFSLCFFVQKV